MQRKTKILAAIIILCTISISSVAFAVTYFASYQRSFTWTVANTTFELQVNGTLQQAQVNPVINFGPLTSADSYCEVYTLTNEGNVPINITATVSLPAGSAIATWLTLDGQPAGSLSDMATIGAGMSVDMVLLLNDFQAAGTATVNFASVKAFILDPIPTLVTTITDTITNDEDSGVVGYWSLDNYVKTVQVWNLGGTTDVAIADFVGTFTTYAGDLSPQAGVAEKATATGSELGSYVGIFTFTGTNPASVITISQDFKGTQADLLKGSYVAGQTGDVPAPVSWITTYFSASADASFNYGNGGNQWGWTYLYSTNAAMGTPAGYYGGQMWNNYGTADNGDIVIP